MGGSSTMHRKLHEIWEEPEPKIPELPWRAQMRDYVAQFPNQAAAEKYVGSIQSYQNRMKLLGNAI